MHSVLKTGRLWKLKCYKNGKGICHFFLILAIWTIWKTCLKDNFSIQFLIFSRSINCKLWEWFKLYWLTSWWSQKNTVNGKYVHEWFHWNIKIMRSGGPKGGFSFFSQEGCKNFRWGAKYMQYAILDALERAWNGKPKCARGGGEAKF